MSIRSLKPNGLWNHFADLNAVPRPSKKEERVIEFMMNFGKELGLETTKDSIGNVIIKKPGSLGMEDKKTVILQSHLDMVHQKNGDTTFDFDSQGISMRVKGDWVDADGTTLGADSMEFEEERYGDTDEYNYGQQFPGDPENARLLRSIRVVERQYYKLKECMFYVDPVTGDMREVPYNWTKKKRESFADDFGLDIMTKTMRKVRWTVTADTVVLFDDWSPYSQFTIVPYFPYFRRGKPFGMVRNLLSPQEQLNKITSQELHIVNTTANSGWIVESGSLSGMTADDLEEHGAETGLVLEFNRGSTPPAKIGANQIPTGLDKLGAKASRNIKEISGITDAMLGQDSPEVSGVAIQQKQNRGSTMLQVPLTNLAKTRQYLAEAILKLVQAYYTEERVVQITDESDPVSYTHLTLPTKA